MTGPFPGQGPSGESPWGGQPPAGDQFPNLGYGGGLYGPPPPPPSPRRRRTRLIVLTAVLAVVVAVGAAATVWAVSANRTSTAPGTPTPAAPPPQASRRTTPSPAGPDSSSAYDIGTCLMETSQPGAPTNLVLQPVQCGAGKDVLVINKVVKKSGDCDAVADYKHHGFVLDDTDAGVSYCLSLVVPVNQCFEFTNNNSKPVQRVACGSTPDAVQVLSIEPAPNPTAACTDKPNPDVWFYQSPTSGQFACVSQLPTSTG